MYPAKRIKTLQTTHILTMSDNLTFIIIKFFFFFSFLFFFWGGGGGGCGGRDCCRLFLLPIHMATFNILPMEASRKSGKDKRRKV